MKKQWCITQHNTHKNMLTSSRYDWASSTEDDPIAEGTTSELSSDEVSVVLEMMDEAVVAPPPLDDDEDVTLL